MGWLMEALGNIILETLNDFIGWVTMLMADFELDIGVPDSYTPWQMVDPTIAYKSPSMFSSVLPGAEKYTYLFAALALLFVFIIMFFKLYQAFFAPFTETEAPLTVIGRTLLASAGIVYSYGIFILFEKIFNRVYKDFKGVYKSQTKKSSEEFNDWYQSQLQVHRDLSGANGEEAQKRAQQNQKSGIYPDERKDAFKLFGQDIIADSVLANGMSSGIALTVIQVIFGCALIFSLFRLVLEVYQRYLTIGVLYFLCPLAFAMLASQNLKKVFWSFIQMMFSQFVLMVFNLFFIGIFIASFESKVLGAGKSIFANDAEFLKYMFIWVAWLVIAQQMDELLRSLGLSVAQTGNGLGSALAGGAVLARATVGTAMRAVGTAGSYGMRKAEGLGREARIDQKARDIFDEGHTLDGQRSIMDGSADPRLMTPQNQKDAPKGLLENSERTEGAAALSAASALHQNPNDIYGGDQVLQDSISIGEDNIKFQTIDGMNRTFTNSPAQLEAPYIQHKGGVNEVLTPDTANQRFGSDQSLAQVRSMAGEGASVKWLNASKDGGGGYYTVTKGDKQSIISPNAMHRSSVGANNNGFTKHNVSEREFVKNFQNTQYKTFGSKK